MISFSVEVSKIELSWIIIYTMVSRHTIKKWMKIYNMQDKQLTSGWRQLGQFSDLWKYSSRLRVLSYNLYKLLNIKLHLPIYKFLK